MPRWDINEVMNLPKLMHLELTNVEMVYRDFETVVLNKEFMKKLKGSLIINIVIRNLEQNEVEALRSHGSTHFDEIITN